MKTYYDINNLIKDLINYDGEEKDRVNISNFNEVSLNGFISSTPDFYNYLTSFMQNEKNRIGHYGIRQKDFPTISQDEFKTVMQYINDKADLIDTFMDKCFSEEQDKINHWNESLQNLIDLFLDLYKEDKFIGDSNVKISDILKADAGNNFNYDDSAAAIERTDQGWVRPWLNIDGNSYSKERLNDKIIRVLNSDNQLQFTRIKSILNKYLRLIMPKYDRIVEIEDLDRNFWVIGQVLSGICEFLFNPENELFKLFEGILDEITQLWENVYYLWTAFALITQNMQYVTTQIIIIPVENDDAYPYIKFDNFVQLDAIFTQKLRYLSDKFNNSSLIIIPEIREKNYSFNYYSGVRYPGVIIKQKDINGYDTTQYHNFATPLYIDLTNASEYTNISYIYENDSQFIIYPDYKSTVPGSYVVKAIRTIPSITFEKDEEGIINNIDLTLSFYDVGRSIANPNQQNNILKIFRFQKRGNVTTESLSPMTPGSIQKTLIAKDTCDYSYYRGEVCSWGLLGNNDFEIQISKEWDFKGYEEKKLNIYEARYFLYKNGENIGNKYIRNEGDQNISFGPLQAFTEDGKKKNDYKIEEQVHLIKNGKRYKETGNFDFAINGKTNSNIISNVSYNNNVFNIKNIYNKKPYEIKRKTIYLKPLFNYEGYTADESYLKSFDPSVTIPKGTSQQDWLDWLSQGNVRNNIKNENEQILKQYIESQKEEMNKNPNTIYIFIGSRFYGDSYSSTPVLSNIPLNVEKSGENFLFINSNNKLEYYTSKYATNHAIEYCIGVSIPFENGERSTKIFKEYQSELSQWIGSSGIYKGSHGLSNIITEFYHPAGEELSPENWLMRYFHIAGRTIDNSSSNETYTANIAANLCNGTIDQVNEKIKRFLSSDRAILFAKNTGERIEPTTYSDENFGIVSSMTIAYAKATPKNNKDFYELSIYRTVSDDENKNMTWNLNNADSIKFKYNWEDRPSLSFNEYQLQSSKTMSGILCTSNAATALDDYKPLFNGETNQVQLDFEHFMNNGYSGTGITPSGGNELTPEIGEIR